MRRPTKGNFLLTIPVLLLAGACGGTSTTTLSGPTVVKCGVTLGVAGGAVPSSGGTGSLSIATAPECTWSAAADASWVTLQRTTGQGESSIPYTVAANPHPAARRAAITVNDQRAEVRQDAAPCRFTVTNATTRIAAAGGSGTADVAADTRCGWDANSHSPWIAIASGASGSGNGRVTFTVARNEGPDRTGSLTVAGQNVSVVQAGATSPPPTTPPPEPPLPSPPTPPPPPAPPPPCSYALSASSGSFAAGGGTATIGVTAASRCAWTASTTASWIRIRGRASGSGDGSVTIEVVASESTTSRTGTVTIAMLTYTATQAGRLPAVRLEGEVGSVTGGCPNLTFTVGDDDEQDVVITDASTDFKGLKCTDVRRGQDVRVDGQRQPDRTVLATKVEKGK